MHLDPRVTTLFQAAMEARIPHNYIALWMMTPPGSSQEPDRSTVWTRLLLRLLTMKVTNARHSGP
jgi:hypothetical protein